MSLTHSTSLATPGQRQAGVPLVCVTGSGERLSRMDTRVYTLPTVQGNAAF